MGFRLNYCDRNNHHIERISITVKNIDHLFYMASERVAAHRPHLFFLSDGSRIDEYLESLENATELIIYTEE